MAFHCKAAVYIHTYNPTVKFIHCKPESHAGIRVQKIGLGGTVGTGSPGRVVGQHF